MCEYCGREDCTLTKEQDIKHGAIIEDNAQNPMREATKFTPMTYSFKGVPAYDSLSALIPDVEEENPHAYIRFIFDEDEGCGKCWESCEVQNPLAWQTEKEFLKALESKQEVAG